MLTRAPIALPVVLVVGVVDARAQAPAAAAGPPAVAARDAAPPETRAAEIQAARDEKARRLQPEAVSRLEALLLQVKQRKLLERLGYGYNGLAASSGTWPREAAWREACG